jgi:glutamate racemase
MPLCKADESTRFYTKNKITILITDSGLGGISICAEIASELMRRHVFEHVSLIYFNAWPEQNRGYNRLSGTAERIRVFDSALEGMMRFEPDFILIACNTLSVLYHRTQFSQHATIPVIDIVGFGVKMITEALKASPKSQAVILGTVTTIASHVHQDRLIHNGIQLGQIVLQPCDQLATEIEKGPASFGVEKMVQAYMRQAARNIDPGCDHVYAALCCTHFGYCRKLIHDTLSNYSKKPVTVLNPNHQMAACLPSSQLENRFSGTGMDIQVVSRITWAEERIRSISNLIQSVSAETATALIHYAHVPNLFHPNISPKQTRNF